MLEREIGRGGMGAVWLARDEVLGRQVALKRIGLLPGGGPSPDLVRAEREAKLAARLNHPHVVAVFDFVADGESQWLVMEYVEGSTLSALAGRRGLKPDQAAPILQQAAEALAAAHQAGIVHRDVKPSNILVTKDGTAKLTDFGIARARQDSTLTQTGLVTGSPAYIAPEVASGRTATEASDVWSLGATAFHALAGRPPYDVGDNVVGTLYRIVHEDPPRLTDAGRLAPLLESTMIHEPKQRWSMAQVRDFLGGESVQPVQPVPPAPARRTPRREETRVIAPDPTAPPPRRPSLLPWIAAAVAVAVLGVGGWLLLSGAEDDRDPPGQADPTTTSTGTADGATAAGMEAFIRTYLQAVADDPSESWESLTPTFQDASGGIEGYREFWDRVKRVDVSDVSADPEAMTVSYRVVYSPAPKGGPKEDRPTLGLVFEDGEYKIASER